MSYDEEHHETCSCGICQAESSFEVISYDELPKEPAEVVQAEDITLHLCVRGRTRTEIADDVHSLLCLLAMKLNQIEVYDLNELLVAQYGDFDLSSDETLILEVL